MELRTAGFGLFMGACPPPKTGWPMDWTSLVDGPLPDVFRENVPAPALQEDCRGSAPLQVDGEDAPSDAGVLTVVDADVDADVDMASSTCSSASAMSCDEPESGECASLAIDEEPPSDSSVPCCLPIAEVPIGEGIPCQGMPPPPKTNQQEVVGGMRQSRFKRKSCWSMPLTWRCAFRGNCCHA